jgi:hypothetical protein
MCVVMTTTSTKFFLNRHDVAVILGEERQRRALAEGRPDPGNNPLDDDTIRTYVVNWSKDPDRHAGPRAVNPPRLPNGPAGLNIWLPYPGETLDDVAEALRDWYQRQPGQIRRSADERNPRAARLAKTNRAPWMRQQAQFLQDKLKPYLDIDDVRRILGEERHRRALLAGHKDPGNKPLERESVRKMVWRYARPESGHRKAHLWRKSEDPNAAVYEANPMPAPNGPAATGRALLIWIPEPGETLTQLEKRIRGWYQKQPGPGSRGKKKINPTTTTKRKKASR